MISARQFAWFRMVLGTYLAIHFIELLPFSGAIWSNQGMLADASLNFTAGVPNPLVTWGNPAFVGIWVLALFMLSLVLITGRMRRICAFLLWIGWTCLFHRNNLIMNPGLPMVGWLLLALALIPSGEPVLGKKADPEWNLSPVIFWGAWWINGLSYFVSAVDKLQSPSWQDGSALTHLLNNPLARDNFLRDWLLQSPEWFLQTQTWLVLAFELLFGFFCLFSKLRKPAWIAMLGMHLGIMCLVDFADLTLGVLMLHLFTFDGRWLKLRWLQTRAISLETTPNPSANINTGLS